MPETRRRLLAAIAGIAAGAIATRSASAGQIAHPQPLPSPNAPQNQNAPAGLDNAGVQDGQQQSRITPLAVSQVRSDVQKLYQMVSDFRDHFAQTNLNATLPLGLIKEAHQIEKLAKQIQAHLKG